MIWLLRAVFVCGGLAVGLTGAAGADADRLPNFVFFYIDDLGWSDPGYQGSDFHETPRIDELAETGVVFTDAYSCGPNCAPSRASLLSGLYPPRHGIYTVGDSFRGRDRDRRLIPVQTKTVLDETVVTWADRLAAHGYHLASVGKWQLGADPRSQGFQTAIAGSQRGSPGKQGYFSPWKFPNLPYARSGEYLTDRLTDEAVKFIESHRQEPFFLYLSHYAVHTPIQAPEELTEKYRRKPPGRHHHHATYAAMIESVDRSVGRILDLLKRLQLEQRTVVLFSSDNGGYVGATSNYPLRGFKGMLYEGGIRVPLIVRWPGVTPPGARCREPVIGVDLFPTIAQISGISVADLGLDGVSLVPLLHNPETHLERSALYWHFPAYLEGRGDPGGGPFRTTPAGAIRSGRWKLIEWFETGRVELYDLRTDIGERQNLADRYPSHRDRLRQQLRNWREATAAPVPVQVNPNFRP